MKRMIFLSLSLLPLISCQTVAPKFDLGEQTVPAPGSWAATREARSGVDEQWLDRFGDPKLEKFVAAALGSNLDLRIAASRLERARTTLKISESALKPDVNLTVDGRRQKQVFAGFPFGGGGTSSSLTNIYGTSLEVDWEIDLWGRIRAGNSAALADLQAESLNYRAARSSLIAQVAKAYYTAVEAEEQVKLAEAALLTNQQTAQAIRERYEAALNEDGGTASQLRLSQTDVATAKATLAERKGLASQTKRQLEILLGQYPKGGLAVPRQLPGLKKRPPVGLPSELLLRRPDILAAERLYASSRVRIKEAQLAKFPSFSLTSTLGTSTTSLRKLLDSDFGAWSLGAKVFQPILINGRLRAEEKAREVNRDQASQELQKTVLNAFSEVEEALANESVLADREVATAEALELAQEAADAAQKDYDGGSGDVITLLTARSRQISLASQLSALRRVRLLNRIDLHLALGGDYKSRN